MTNSKRRQNETLEAVALHRPELTGREMTYVADVLASGQLGGGGIFTDKCHRWLEQHIGCKKALLTHSCTGALEMAALLLNLRPGDEVIMPSFNFVTTATAFVLRGAVPVFVDIRPDTLNIDEILVEAAVTNRTRAIVCVHYAGVGCDMKRLAEIAQRRSLYLIEDAAHAIGGQVDGRPLGGIGNLGALSFHQTKNIVAGEGGALLVNDDRLTARAETIWNKGTDRARFMEGEVDKYSWVDVGSSFQPSEITAAVLLAQLEASETLTERRLSIWNRYHAAFADLETAGHLRRPVIPANCRPNGHIYFILLPTMKRRKECQQYLASEGIEATSHYVPLHDSPGGRRYGRAGGELGNTVDLANRLLRLPLGRISDENADRVIGAVRRAVTA